MSAKSSRRRRQSSSRIFREFIAGVSPKQIAKNLESGEHRRPVRRRLTIRRDEVETRVLRVLQDKLLRQDLFEEFCDEFTREMNRLRMEQRASLSTPEREIERIEVRRKKLIKMVMNGVAPSRRC